jgi:hypothetical protein
MSPEVTNRQQLASEELREFAMTGPFGGIQSELSLTGIEQLGFADARNFIFRKGRADLRPSYTTLPALPAPSNEPILAIPSFYNSNGQQIQCVITPTRLLQFTGGGWVRITGPAFTGSANQLFAWDIIDQKLCFSQGTDPLFIWDGASSSYTQPAGAPPASILAEVAGHLLAVNPANPQTYLWSGLNDPTDWTSFSAGSNNFFNNLGPIHQIIKIGQYGFGLYHDGIVQIVPTGIGTAPFAFYTIINASQGTIAPHSVDHFDDQGVEYGVYLGIDNVYVFNGSSVDSIGDRPIGGGKRYGARSRILADVKTVDPHMIYGFVSYSIEGNIFKAYWLNIPNVAVWVYNFDEGNWTVFNYTNEIRTLGNFYQSSPIRIMDLVGSIESQSWTPATLQSDDHFGGMLLGFNNGVGGFVDFTNYSELPGSIISGSLIFGDRRHSHVVKKYRLSIRDAGSATYTMTLSNEKGYSQQQVFTLGSGSGDDLNYIMSFSITGLRITWRLDVAAAQPASVIEFCPMYDVSGEQRGGVLEN